MTNTPIPLGGDGASRYPSVKLAAVGSTITVMLVDIEEEPWIDFHTKQQKVGDDGRPRTKEVVTGLVVSAVGAATADGSQVFTGGETVKIHLAGHKRWSWVQAKEALGRQPQVGDLFAWTHTHDEAPASAGFSAKQVHEGVLTPAGPEWAEWVALATQAHHEKRNGPAPALGNEPFPAGQQVPSPQQQAAAVGHPSAQPPAAPAAVPAQAPAAPAQVPPAAAPAPVAPQMPYGGDEPF